MTPNTELFVYMWSLHDCIFDAIPNQNPGEVTNVEVYKDEYRHDFPKTPVVIIELDEMTFDEDDENQIAVDCFMNAHCVLGIQTRISNQDLELQLRIFGLAVGRIIYGNDLGFDFVSRPERFHIGPGKFVDMGDSAKKGGTGYDSWVVSWHQTITVDRLLLPKEGDVGEFELYNAEHRIGDTLENAIDNMTLEGSDG